MADYETQQIESYEEQAIGQGAYGVSAYRM
jgi:hypothetical protein